jgi:hypothetical protein
MHIRIFCGDISKSMAAAGRSQARFVTALLGFLALVWGWHFMRPTGLAIQVLGVTLVPTGLWTISPAVLTVLVLSLIGSMNIMGPIWKRLRDCADRLGQVFFWTDLDPNKTLIDFFTYLTIWPEGMVEPVTAPKEDERYRFAVFSYPAVTLLATMTTGMSDYPCAPFRYRVYVYACVVVQGLFSFRIWYRAVCRFFLVRREQTEV